PPAAKFTDCQHQLIAALLQGKVNGVVLGIHDPEEPWIAKTLSAAAAVKDLAIQKNADVIAVADLELLHLFAVGVDGGFRIHKFHARLRIETLRKVCLERDIQMRRLKIAIENDKARQLGVD